jgi:murein DD-endopeptidase MepM/ murein hydrolase activator NlpD
MRTAILLAVCLALAGVAASARADTFAIVPADTPVLPSAFQPNAPDSVGLPPALLSPPGQPEQLDPAQLLGVWKRAGAAYGIPWQVLGAINKVESNFGRNMGPSSAGAIGWMQFMPSTWLRWGTDGSGDGVADPWNPQDAVTSAARYLAAAGGQSDLHRAVFAYNHADWYVHEVLALAQTYTGGATFQLDGMQQGLDNAQQAVSAANGALVVAQLRVQALTALQSRWVERSASAPLLSDRLAADKQATLAGVSVDAASAGLGGLRDRLAQAQAALEQARQNAQAASFDQGAAPLLGAPSYEGRYVFPVAGGPGTVSVSHFHHDYPAADIAAPEGSPVYALADATVLRSWSEPDPRCGIGFTLQAFDGRSWTYCHLSYLEPSVVPGARLQAGDPVGLVGHTGHASGPHLHLQLQPATQYPQSEPWFQQFAGVAFTWRDDGPNDAPGSAPARGLAVFGAPRASAAAPHPVFSVVPAAPAPAGGGVVLFTPGS